MIRWNGEGKGKSNGGAHRATAQDGGPHPGGGQPAPTGTAGNQRPAAKAAGGARGGASGAAETDATAGADAAADAGSREADARDTGAHHEAKHRAAAVVMAYREVDWEAIERGDREAVAGLVSACDQHEQTRQFLQSQDGDAVAARLDAGLERFYAEHIAPRLRSKSVLQQMLAVAEPPTMAGGSTGVADGAGPEEGLLPRSRPAVTTGHTMRMNTGCGNLYVTVNEDDSGHPFELFNHMGKAGGCAASQNEAIGRLISYALRCGAKIEPLIKQLKGISCHRPAWSEDGKISSCADAISKALEKYYLARQARESLPFPERPANGGAHRVQGAATDVPDRPPIEVAPADLDAGGAALAAEDRARFGAHATEELLIERQHLSTLIATPTGLRATATDEISVQGACPECGGSHLAFEEGCVKCYSCAFTECG